MAVIRFPTRRVESLAASLPHIILLYTSRIISETVFLFFVVFHEYYYVFVFVFTLDTFSLTVAEKYYCNPIDKQME